MFVTASDFWFPTLLKINSTIDVFPPSFTNLARAVIFRNTLEPLSYDLSSVFGLKNSSYKTFWKTVEYHVKNCNFLFLSGFSLYVLQKPY